MVRTVRSGVLRQTNAMGGEDAHHQATASVLMDGQVKHAIFALPQAQARKLALSEGACHLLDVTGMDDAKKP